MGKREKGRGLRRGGGKAKGGEVKRIHGSTGGNGRRDVEGKEEKGREVKRDWCGEEERKGR